MSYHINAIHAYILAGGESRRFGNSEENKAFAQLNGKPLILHTIEFLDLHFKDIFIITKNANQYDTLGYPILKDISTTQNPIVGLLTGLMHTHCDWNFFTACDMPFLTANLIQSLTQKLPDIDNSIKAIVPVTDGSIQPLATLYHRSLADEIERKKDAIDSLKSLIKQTSTLLVDFKSEKPFTNVNTQEELKNLYR